MYSNKQYLDNSQKLANHQSNMANHLANQETTIPLDMNSESEASNHCDSEDDHNDRFELDDEQTVDSDNKLPDHATNDTIAHPPLY